MNNTNNNINILKYLNLYLNKENHEFIKYY